MAETQKEKDARLWKLVFDAIRTCQRFANEVPRVDYLIDELRKAGVTIEPPPPPEKTYTITLTEAERLALEYAMSDGPGVSAVDPVLRHELWARIGRLQNTPDPVAS